MKIIDMFKELKKHEGEEIECYYWWYGNPIKYEDTLEKVKYYNGIECRNSFIPFIGYGCAIVEIKLKSNNKAIYYNSNIENGYDRRNQNEIEKLKVISFGHEIVFKQRSRRVTKEQEIKTEIELADKQARLKKSILTKRGLKYVREDLREEWIKYVDINTTDFYSCGVVEMACDMMDELNNGASREDITQMLLKKGATTRMIALIREAILYFTNLMDVINLPNNTGPQRKLK